MSEQPAGATHAGARSRSTSCTTTSCASIKACGSRQQWRQASRQSFGRWRIWCGLSRTGRRLAQQSRAIDWLAEAAPQGGRRGYPVFAHGANEPRPIPNLRAGMGGLPVEHLSGVLARLMVRGKIDIMADSERVFAVPEVYSIRSGRNGTGLPHWACLLCICGSARNRAFGGRRLSPSVADVQESHGNVRQRTERTGFVSRVHVTIKLNHYPARGSVSVLNVTASRGQEDDYDRVALRPRRSAL